MRAQQKLSKLCERVLKNEFRKGETTKQACVIAAFNNAQRSGGPDKLMDPAFQLMMMKRSITDEFERLFKSNLPETVIHHAFRNAPPEIRDVLGKCPSWIATSEGTNARRVPAVKATSNDWRDSANMKSRKARQTRDKATIDFSIADMLDTYGYHTLADAGESPSTS